LPEPSVGAFDLPASFVTSQFSAILLFPLLVVVPIGSDQFNTPLFPSLAQQIGVVAAVGDHWLRLLPRPLRGGTRTWLSVASASVTSAGEALSSRTPSPSPHTIHFVPLPRLILPTAWPPFLAGVKLLSRKASSHFRRPFSSNAPSKVRHALSQTPSCSHCFNRRQ
jgi:hypothetical protein